MKKFMLSLFAAGMILLFAMCAFSGITNPVLLSDSVLASSVPIVESYHDADKLEIYYIGEVTKYEKYLREVRIDPLKWSSKPVPKNTVPTKQYGLLNPDKPIIIGYLADAPVKLGLDYYQYGDADMRILDENGNTLGTVTEKNPEFLLHVSSRPKKYYLEFYEPGLSAINPQTITPHYCYVLLQTPKLVTKVQRADITIRAEERYRKEHKKGKDEDLTGDELLAIMNMVDAEIENMSISDIERGQTQLTLKDRQNLQAQASSSQLGQALSQQQIISNYMKQHNIKSMASLTEKDMQEIKKQLMRNSIASLPAQQRSVIDTYMKQHNIASYEDITEKDIEAIEKLMNQKPAKQTTPKKVRSKRRK